MQRLMPSRFVFRGMQTWRRWYVTSKTPTEGAVSRVAPAQRGPEPTALVVAQPAKRTPGAVISMHPPDAMLWDVRRLMWPKLLAANLTRSEGASGSDATTFMRLCQLSSRFCSYQILTTGGCRKGIACDFRHVVSRKPVVLPPKDLCDIRASNLFEYAPTRDNKRIEHDACSRTALEPRT